MKFENSKEIVEGMASRIPEATMVILYITQDKKEMKLAMFKKNRKRTVAVRDGRLLVAAPVEKNTLETVREMREHYQES